MDKNNQKKHNNRDTKHKTNELKERVKELDGLYRLTNIVKDKTLQPGKALNNIIELIPPAWQYPKTT